MGKTMLCCVAALALAAGAVAASYSYGGQWGSPGAGNG